MVRREFGGSLGAAVITLGLPPFVFLVHVVIKFWNWTLFDPSNYATLLSVDSLRGYWAELAPTSFTIGLVTAWFAIQVFLYYAAPGPWVKGLPDRETGETLQYPINGLFTYIMSVGFVFGGYAVNLYSPATIVDNYHRLAVTSFIFSISLAIFLYLKGLSVPPEHRHSTGSFFYDFYMGLERNPRIGRFDFKFFCEGRPGLTAWSCLSFIFLLAQYDRYGRVSPALVICSVLHAIYIADYFVFEDAILTTLDITKDEFGYMLAFGDISYVPFLYPLSSFYLIHNSPDWPMYIWVGVAALGAFAYYAFRRSNSERDEFKRGLLVNAKSFTMKRRNGSTNKYLVSGWSSLARRPNYWPDLLNATTYSLCTGFSAVLPWIYPILFFILLTHRQHRIEEQGKLNYKNWDEYCKVVPYRYLPYLI